MDKDKHLAEIDKRLRSVGFYLPKLTTKDGYISFRHAPYGNIGKAKTINVFIGNEQAMSDYSHACYRLITAYMQAKEQ